MEPLSPPDPRSAEAIRLDVVSRLRQQVAAGSYQPPVDELVNRLVNLVLARRAGE